MRTVLLSTAAIVLAALAFIYFGNRSEQQGNAANASMEISTSATQPSSATSSGTLEVGKSAQDKTSTELLTKAPLPTDFVMGNAKAPLKLIEYASLSCPHCAHFHTTILPVLEQNYIKTGKVLYILRQFPLNAPALKGAALLDCIGETEGAERYYTFARVLFESQNKWAFDAGFLKSLQTFASVGGVSEEKFRECTDEKREAKILAMKKDANDQLHIPHTPTIYLNGEMYNGGLTPEEFSQAIDAKLAGKK